TRVIEYEPEDMVAVVEAGVPLQALDALVREAAQRVGPDPWPGQAATVGGAVAANRCGIARRVRGTWRDAALGARLVHADGRTSKTGGKVVKNVAGFDLAKLYVGSHGAYGILTEINVRLMPRPRTASTLVVSCTRPRLHDTWLALHRSALTPVSCTAVHGAL